MSVDEVVERPHRRLSHRETTADKKEGKKTRKQNKVPDYTSAVSTPVRDVDSVTPTAIDCFLEYRYPVYFMEKKKKEAAERSVIVFVHNRERVVVTVSQTLFYF